MVNNIKIAALALGLLSSQAYAIPYYKVCNQYQCSTSTDNPFEGLAAYYGVTISYCDPECRVVEDAPKILPHCSEVPWREQVLNARGDVGLAASEPCRE